MITSAKHHLPNYGVFDEYRYFVPGNALPVFRLPAGEGADGQQAAAVDVAIAVCEDLWQDGGPVAVARQAGAGLLVVPNASPWEQGKDDSRLLLCQRRAGEAGAPLAYANMIGGQDELVFDGDSIIVAADGTLLARGPQFEEALVVADVEVAAADLSRAPGEEPAQAGDGTSMTIRRVELAPRPPARPGRPARPAQTRRRRRGRGCPTWTRRTRPWSPASAITSPRTSSAPCCSACPAASTRPSPRPLPPTPSARAAFTWC